MTEDLVKRLREATRAYIDHYLLDELETPDSVGIDQAQHAMIVELDEAERGVAERLATPQAGDAVERVARALAADSTSEDAFMTGDNRGGWEALARVALSAAPNAGLIEALRPFAQIVEARDRDALSQGFKISHSAISAPYALFDRARQLVAALDTVRGG